MGDIKRKIGTEKRKETREHDCALIRKSTESPKTTILETIVENNGDIQEKPLEVENEPELEEEFKNTDSHMWDIVPVRGKEVQVTPRMICDFYNAPYYEKYFIEEIDLEYFRDIDKDKIINYLTESKGEWKYRSVTALCKKTGVPMTSTEQSLKPSKFIIENTLFEQYIELRAK
ncbi:hypothetical protein J1N35_034985 [Gossypium stocksii]|uniref:Uncharacterized protein n=1 Tax=Gossypium stocksii TaxID=47602 RepID=A0A9D3ZR84_9ROSI|nr:hypothetical protein J1N35_034985 [Gossypium stocksii]